MFPSNELKKEFVFWVEVVIIWSALFLSVEVSAALFLAHRHRIKVIVGDLVASFSDPMGTIGSVGRK
ncbi:MAG TPA: hypothetical protein VF974_08060 [Patescibacteria group bacterium]